MAESSDEVVPYKICSRPLKEMETVAINRLRLFNGR